MCDFKDLNRLIAADVNDDRQVVNAVFVGVCGTLYGYRDKLNVELASAISTFGKSGIPMFLYDYDSVYNRDVMKAVTEDRNIRKAELQSVGLNFSDYISVDYIDTYLRVAFSGRLGLVVQSHPTSDVYPLFRPARLVNSGQEYQPDLFEQIKKRMLARDFFSEINPQIRHGK